MQSKKKMLQLMSGTKVEASGAARKSCFELFQASRTFCESSLPI